VAQGLHWRGQLRGLQVDEDDLYAAMDWLLKQRIAIQASLAGGTVRERWRSMT